MRPAPADLAALCTRAQAERLAPYDHHRVRVQGRWGILLTYHWAESGDAIGVAGALEPRQVLISLDPGRSHGLTPERIRALIHAHPPAPAEIQALVDTLAFQPAATPPRE